MDDARKTARNRLLLENGLIESNANPDVVSNHNVTKANLPYRLPHGTIAPCAAVARPYPLTRAEHKAHRQALRTPPDASARPRSAVKAEGQDQGGCGRGKKGGGPGEKLPTPRATHERRARQRGRCARPPARTPLGHLTRTRVTSNPKNAGVFDMNDELL